MVAILVPVLQRPQSVTPLLASISAATSLPYSVLFIADPGDLDEQRAIHEHNGDALLIAGNYAAKINAAVRATTEPLLFIGADDLHFQPGWLEAATARINEGAHVVGVNDLIHRRRHGHATHFLMTREYAEQPSIDGSQGPIFEGYDHSFIDDELIATATKRGVYVYEPRAHVEHKHPMNGTAPDDDTYRRGRRQFRRDRRLFQTRARLWT